MWEAVAAQVIGSAVKGGMTDSGPNVSGYSTVISGGAGDDALKHILEAREQPPFWAWGGTSPSVPNGLGVSGDGVSVGWPVLIVAAGLALLLARSKR